jgi:acyl-coenzyme A synthetase/AMP-(fatty) acid ligase
MGRVFQQIALQFAATPAVINVERDRRFTYAQMHELTNRLSNALKHRFGLKQNDFYATILDNDNMSLFHPWMLKSPVGAVWIDANETVGEQANQIDYIQPKLVFLETRLLPLLYEHLQTCRISMVAMDRPQKSWPRVYYFWDLVEQAANAEVAEEFAADEASEHISVLRFTGGTTDLGLQSGPLLRNFSL